MLKTLLKIKRRGEKVEALEKRPEVYQPFKHLWKAVATLEADRVWYLGAMGGVIAGRIPTQAIESWLSIHNIEGEEKIFYFDVIRAVDGIWSNELKNEAPKT